MSDPREPDSRGSSRSGPRPAPPVDVVADPRPGSRLEDDDPVPDCRPRARRRSLFCQLVLAPIIELGSLRVLGETGVAVTSRTCACRRCIFARSRRRRRCRAALLVPMPHGTVGCLSSVLGGRGFASALGHWSTLGGSWRSQLPLGARVASRHMRFSRFTRPQFIFPLTVLAPLRRGSSGPGNAWPAVAGLYPAGEWSSSVFSVRVVVSGAIDSSGGRDPLARGSACWPACALRSLRYGVEEDHLAGCQGKPR
jgi:hypothetical protein